MKKIFFTILIFSLFLTNSGAKAGKALVNLAERQATGGDLELVARFDFTNPLSMVASGDLVFVGMQINQGYQVAILDATDPAEPVEVAAIDLGENEIRPLGVIGEMLYISVMEEGIRIYDISTPAAPALVKTFNPLEAFFPGQMVFSANLAYLADLNGLVILDVSDPANPALVGYESNGSSIFSLAVQGDKVYTLESGSNDYWDWGGALRAYDIANPAQPLLLDEYYVDDPTHLRLSPTMLAVKGSYAYLSGLVFNPIGVNGYYAELINISDPADLRKLGDLPALAAPNNQLVVAGDLLYAARTDGLAIFDLSNLVDPQPLGAYPGYNGLAVQPQAGRTTFLDQQSGLQLLDISNSARPKLLGFYNWPQESSNIEVVGTNLYTLKTYDSHYPMFYNYSSLLQVIDISDPHLPRVSGQAFIDIYTSDQYIVGEIFVDGTTVYLPAENGLTIVDTANLEDMQTVNLGFYDVQAVEFKQDTAYVLSGGPVLSTIDVTEPLAPSVLGELTVEGYPIDLSVAEQGDRTMAYILTGSGWWAVDVSNPAALLVVYQYSSAQELQRITTETLGDKTIAYLAKAVSSTYNSPDEGLAAIDVNDPTDPLEVGFYPMDMESATVLMVEDAMVYFAGGDLKLIDFSVPTHPVYAARAAVTGVSIVDASLNQEYIVVASEWGDVVFFAKRSNLEGRVTDHNYQPFPGVSLALSNGEAALSDTGGYFGFPDLEFGSYAITPTLAGFTFAPQYRQVMLPHDQKGQNFVILPVPVSTELTPGITTTLTYTDVQGLPTSFTFPAGLVDAPATAIVTPTLGEGFFGMDFAGHAFELSLLAGGEPVYSTTFPAPVSITIQYSPLDTAVISDTLMLALYRQDGAAWVKTEDTCSASPTPVPIEPGIFRTTVCQSGRYALFGPTYAIALPQVSYGSDTSEVILP